MIDFEALWDRFWLRALRHAAHLLPEMTSKIWFFFQSIFNSFSNTLWNRFWTNFWLIFGPFFIPKSMPKASLLTFDVVYTQSLILNTPHSVLKDFCFRETSKIDPKSLQNHMFWHLLWVRFGATQMLLFEALWWIAEKGPPQCRILVFFQWEWPPGVRVSDFSATRHPPWEPP